MRLLFIIDCLGSGGAQRQMVSLALGLVRRGHSVEFFTYYPQYDHFAGVLNAAHIAINCHKKTRRFSLAPVVALRQLITERRFDGALSFLGTPNFYLEIAGLGLEEKFFVVSERFMLPQKRLSVPKWVALQGHRFADHVTVNSHHQRRRLEKEFPWIRSKISTIYNGVDLTEFQPPSPLFQHHNQLQLLAVGTVIAKKNVSGLVRALSLFRERHGQPPILRWVGKVDNSDDGRYAFAEACELIAALGLTNHWQWMGERSDIAALLRAHDALIHPSFAEGLPNAVCEALAAGRPVLAGDIGDHRLLVADGVTGFLFDPGRPLDMADAIHRLVSATQLERNQMSLAARRYAEQELSLEALTVRYEDLFLRMCKRR